MLREARIAFLLADLACDLVPLLRTLRYSPAVIWSSNLLNDHFSNLVPGLRRVPEDLLGLVRLPEPAGIGHEIYVLQDQRDTWRLPAALQGGRPWTGSRRSSHVWAFREVAARLLGTRNLELVTEERWITEDEGVSKLPCTDYLLVDGNAVLPNGPFDTVFLHILLGHGLSFARFEEIARWARQSAHRVLVLEHDARSPDFMLQGVGQTPDKVRAVLGEEQELVVIRGSRPWRRNFLMVYDLSPARGAAASC